MLRLKYKNKNQLLMILLVVGFFIGVIYENVIFKKHFVSTEFFSKSNLLRFLQTDVIAEKYFWYVIKDRLFFLFIICALGSTKWKKTVVTTCLLLIGFFMGTLCVASALALGMKGILLCIAGLFPHMLFYGLLYGLLFIYWFHYPEKQWNRVKLFFVLLMFVVGLIVEIYVNPIIVKFMIGII